jgi:hypothetical protein
MTPVRRTRIPHDVEEAVLALAAERPILGRIRAAAELNRRGFAATPSTVRSVWRRHGLQNSEKRIRAFAPADGGDGSQVAAISCEIPARSIPAHDHMTDAFVFSLAAVAFFGFAAADTLDQPLAQNFHPWQEATPALGEDHAGLTGYDAAIETALTHQFALPPLDFVV